MIENESSVRAVVFPDGGAWIAQCLDYDICAQGPDPVTAQRRFLATLSADLHESMLRHGELFLGIGPAPDWVVNKWGSRDQDAASFRSNGSLALNNRPSVNYEMALCA